MSVMAVWWKPLVRNHISYCKQQSNSAFKMTFWIVDVSIEYYSRAAVTGRHANKTQTWMILFKLVNVMMDPPLNSNY